MNEIKPLTGIRGIAAIWVVLYHYFPSVESNLIAKGYLSVDLFFILSALVMTLSYGQKFAASVSLSAYLKYLVKRIARIYPLYFVTTILSFALGQTFSLSHILTYLSFTETFFSTYLNAINYPIWSLATEFFAYLILPFLILFLFRANKTVRVISAVAALTLITSTTIYPSHFFDLNTKMLGTVPADGLIDINMGTMAYARTMASYILGILCSIYFSRINLSVAILAGIGFVATVLFSFNDISIYAFIILLPLVCVKIKYIARFLAWKPIHFLGEISYSLYLNHILVLTAFKRYWPVEYYYYYAIPVTVAFSIVTYYFIELPGKKLLNNRTISRLKV